MYIFICWTILKEITDSVYQGLKEPACYRIYCPEPTLGSPRLFVFFWQGWEDTREWVASTSQQGGVKIMGLGLRWWSSDWLRLDAPNAGDQGSIPGQGTESYTLQLWPGTAK